MVAVERVPAWFMEQGIGHVVMQTGPGGMHTACHTWYPSGAEPEEFIKTKPKRICSKCRAALKDIVPATKKCLEKA